MIAVAGIRRAGPKPRLGAVAWAVAAVSLTGITVAWVLAARNRDLLDISADFGPDRFLAAYAIVGAVVASRRPANPIGWLLLGIGLVTAFRAVAGEYALHALAGSARPASAVWAAWFVSWSLTLLFPVGLLTFLLLLFPNGRAITPRWRVVGWLGAGLGAFYVLANWFGHSTIAVNGLPGVPNPTGIQGVIAISRSSPVGNAVWLVGWVCLAAAAGSVFVRYRRSAGEERQQLKWFAYAAVLSLSVLVVLLPVSVVVKNGGALFDAAVVAGIGLAVPLAIGVAVLKYRLYSIDKIISRTVSYALVTGLVAGVYVGCVLLLTRVLPLRGGVGVAVAVLAAAALFNPLRRRVQGAVDRRFNRARYDAEQVVGRFAAQLSEEVDLDVLGAGLLHVVDHVLAPAHLGLWLNDATAGERHGPAAAAAGRHQPPAAT